MEVMVSVSIFAIIMTVGIGSLLAINVNYKKSETDRQAVDNLSYVLESMSRRIRTATTWGGTHCTISYNSSLPTSCFEMTDQDGIDVLYTLTSDNVITMTTTDPTTNIPQVYDLTPGGTQTSVLTFLPLKNSSGLGQPYLQINVQGTVTNGSVSSDFQFQTAVSKRSFD